MLKSLRNSVKSPFMKLFLLLLVLGFGLWGIGDISTGLITKKNEAFHQIIILSQQMKL